jgi:UPF0716 protein FxsA
MLAIIAGCGKQSVRRLVWVAILLLLSVMMNPLILLFLIFLLVPLAEIVVLIEVGSVIGTLPTVAMVVLTAVIGAFLVRAEGLITLQRAKTAMGQGELPAMELIEGVFILLAGALLLTPGFVTDAFGFCCLIPPLRRYVIRNFLHQRMVVRVTPREQGHGGQRTIEGEFKNWDE